MERISKKMEENNYIRENHSNAKIDHKKLLLKDKLLPSKVFEERSSIYEEIYVNKHAATVYNLFLAIVLSLFLNLLIHDYLYKGEINLGFNLIVKGYSKLHLSITIWLGMFVASFLCYYGFKLWASIRNLLLQNTTNIKFWDMFMIGLVIFYFSLFLYCPPYFISLYEIPIASSVTLLLDNVRILMIFYSFIITNASRVLRNQKENKTIALPDLSTFLYFYFAPTAIYRDVYPRSQNRNWKTIFGYIIKFCGCAFFMSLLIEIFFINKFKDYGLRPYPVKEIIMILLNNTFIGLLFEFGLGYIVLHVWFNMFGELMKFSDRRFYEDWWTSSNFHRFRRTWNLVVHDWLYIYIYKDFYEKVYSGSKTPAKLLVMIISAFFHEYVLAISFGYCVPIYFVNALLISAIPFSTLQLKSSLIGNILVLYSISLGMGVVMSFHAMEYYSRVNCPIDNFTVYDYFVPQLFSCNK